MKSSNDVKKSLLSHSEAKVNLLGEYMNRYLNIICNDRATTRIKIYDLFCGEGIYENGGEGSPLVIMKAVKNTHYRNMARRELKTKIDCHFNDIDSSKVEKVENAILNNNLYYPEFGNLDFSSIDYKRYLDKLVGELKGLNREKAFVFVDPYEYKHIKMNHIKRLMANKNTEVLLWLPTQFMYRFERNGTPTALKDFIKELDPEENWNPSSNVWGFVDELKKAFQTSMGNEYFVDNFTIQKSNNTIFSLFFFTSHIKGFEKMLESKWKIDQEQGKGWNYLGNQPTLFHQQKTNPLADKLRDYLQKSQRNKTNGEVYEYTLREGFLPTHTKDIFTNWQKLGELEVILNNGKKARKKAFYISYKSFKEESCKVSFKLKQNGTIDD